MVFCNLHCMQQMDLYTVRYICVCVCTICLLCIYSVSIYLLTPVHFPPASHLPPICPLSHTYLPPAQCSAIPSSRQHVPIFSKLPSCWCSTGAVSVRSTWNQR